MTFVHMQVGDQILEVNRISFFSIVHSDAANALRYLELCVRAHYC